MATRIVSGMRPTGELHLGHLRGVLHNWRKLQNADNECFFFIADWHALTTDYDNVSDLSATANEMVAMWLAAGIESQHAVIFRQSDVAAHAELFTLLSMICPLPWLTHLPTYKEQKEQLQKKLDTHGFLGYPLLQSADIMLYKADYVPVGEDQIPHIEFTREIARRFNRFYGNSESFQRRYEAITVEKKTARQLRQSKEQYAKDGDKAIMESALALIESLSLSDEDKRVLRSQWLYGGDEILRLPQSLLAPTPRLPGVDGRKMSKSYNNTINLSDSPAIINKKIAQMQTDPARIRRSDKGNPNHCPVWTLHQTFSDDDTQQWAQAGCVSATIGCVECKKRLAEFINNELSPITQNRAKIDDAMVSETLTQGAKRARELAEHTLDAVRQAMKIRHVR